MHKKRQRTYRAFTFFTKVRIILFAVVWLVLNQHIAHGQRVVAAEPSQQTHKLHLQFSGEQPRPLSMVAGDFDEDGINDLVVGYGLTKGGSIAFLRGNLDAHAPQTHESWLAAGMRQYSDPYLQDRKAVPVSQQPGLMISADVNGDGHLDLVFAAKGNAQINVKFGDGRGNFSSPLSVMLPGGITAVAAYRPGAPLLGEAIVAAYRTNQGARVSILTYGSAGLLTRATYALPAAASSMVVANLDADLIPDTAIVAGGQLLILHGKNALSGGAQVSTVPVLEVESVSAGEFLFDRHAQLQLSVVTANGDVVTLAHEGFDPRPYTPQEIAAQRLAQQHGNANNTPTLAQQAGNTGNAPWAEVERVSGAAARSTGGRAPIIVRARGATGLANAVVLNPSEQQQTIISHSRLTSGALSDERSEARVATTTLGADEVVAALSASVSPDARDGLVVLTANSASPQVTLPSAGNTFYVTTPADNTGTTTDPSDGVRCTQATNPTETCTLRDAITFANSDAADNISSGNSDTIMVPAGTYNLTWQAGTFDANANAVTHLEILGPMTIIGVSGSTIINGNNNDLIFTVNPGQFGSFNPSGDSYVFDLTLENLIIENGQNNNNPANSTTGFSNSSGGCFNWDAFGTGDLTIANSTIENCFAQWGSGGAIWAINSAGGGSGMLTLNTDAIQSNKTPEEGGAVYIGFAPVAVAVTNTTINGNTADATLNSSDGTAFGSGGGFSFTARSAPPPSTPQSTLTNVTISSNTAKQVDGGGIESSTGLLINSSVISGNSAGRWGGGIFSEVDSPEIQTTITNSDIISNFATAAGGGISVGPEIQANGNILQIGLSRIFGNTSTNGVNGLAAGAPGNSDAGEAIATDNWWGCNAGPTTSGDGCDQAVLYNASGSLTTAPYAVLSFTSDTTTIPSGGSMNLTVGLNTGSDGNPISGAFPAVATNYPYTYNVSGVTANPALTTGIFDTSGVGTATLTPVTPSSNTSGSVTVTFDNQTETINFTAEAATATSLAISGNPSLNFNYGVPSSYTVQLSPSNATGISASNFVVTVDGVSTGYSLSLISNNNYQLSGPFNVLAPGSHTLKISFSGTATYAASTTSASIVVGLGSVTLGDSATPTKPVQGQGGTVTVTVTQSGTGAVPTGSINYAWNGGSSQAVTLSGGTANITIPTVIPTGSNSLSLIYTGDTNYAGASTTATITVLGNSVTTIASLTTTSAQIDVVGLGTTAPTGQVVLNDVTAGSTQVGGPLTLNTSAAMPTLLPQVTTQTGTYPVWTEIADINGDGIPDQITSIFGTDSVSVALGNGNGTFGTATSIQVQTGFGPSEVHAVSLRGNGMLDLIVGSYNINEIAVLLGNGNGTFQTPVFYTIGTAVNTPTALTTGDFNHDGHLDVAVANTGDNTVSILLGNGSGSLTASGGAIGVGRGPEAIRSADFNEDGYSDLAIANYHDGTVSILLNNQNETFTVNTITVGTGPQAIAITGSGNSLLLAVANFDSNNISVLPGNGAGSFGAQKLISVGHGPDDVRFADVNGDSVPDLIVANYTDGTVNVAIGSTGGTYSVLGPFAIGAKPYSAAVGDLNNDGAQDVVVANTFSSSTGVLMGGTQVSGNLSGLSLTAGHDITATYSPDANSSYGGSTSPSATVP